MVKCVIKSPQNAGKVIQENSNLKIFLGEHAPGTPRKSHTFGAHSTPHTFSTCFNQNAPLNLLRASPYNLASMLLPSGSPLRETPDLFCCVFPPSFSELAVSTSFFEDELSKKSAGRLDKHKLHTLVYMHAKSTVYFKINTQTENNFIKRNIFYRM